MKKTILVLLAFTTLSACNTFQGIGTDIQKGGRAIQEAATPHHQSNVNN